jgi:hypothetical protein
MSELAPIRQSDPPSSPRGPRVSRRWLLRDLPQDASNVAMAVAQPRSGGAAIVENAIAAARNPDKTLRVLEAAKDRWVASRDAPRSFVPAFNLRLAEKYAIEAGSIRVCSDVAQIAALLGHDCSRLVTNIKEFLIEDGSGEGYELADVHIALKDFKGFDDLIRRSGHDMHDGISWGESLLKAAVAKHKQGINPNGDIEAARKLLQRSYSPWSVTPFVNLTQATHRMGEMDPHYLLKVLDGIRAREEDTPEITQRRMTNRHDAFTLFLETDLREARALLPELERGGRINTDLVPKSNLMGRIDFLQAAVEWGEYGAIEQMAGEAASEAWDFTRKYQEIVIFDDIVRDTAHLEALRDVARHLTGQRIPHDRIAAYLLNRNHTMDAVLKLLEPFVGYVRVTGGNASSFISQVEAKMRRIRVQQQDEHVEMTQKLKGESLMPDYALTDEELKPLIKARVTLGDIRGAHVLCRELIAENERTGGMYDAAIARSLASIARREHGLLLGNK